jgi:hypothetical protein
MASEQIPHVASDKPKQKQLDYRIPPEGMTRIYSNNVLLAATRFDLRILFGEIVDITEDTAVIENRVQVTMTWLEAKLLADFLTANIKEFEDINGPLKLPTIQQQLVIPQTFPDAK